MRWIFILVILTLSLPWMLVTSAFAQQSAARGMVGNMELMRLENRLKVLEAGNARMQACQQQGKFYLLGSPKADEQGCLDGLDGLYLGSTFPGSMAYTGKYSMIHPIVFSVVVQNNRLEIYYVANRGAVKCESYYDGNSFSACSCGLRDTERRFECHSGDLQ